MPRMTRKMLSRSVGVDSAMCLGFWRPWAGESLRGIRGTFHIVGLPNLGNALKYQGPWTAMEYNFYAMWVPNAVWTGITAQPTSGTQYDSVPREPTSTDDLDNLFRKVVFEFGTDGNEWYGANPDGTTGVTYDPIRNMYTTTRGADARDDDAPSGNEPTSGGQTDRSGFGVTDEPLTVMGPLGIQRLYSRESLLLPKQLPGAAAQSGTAGSGIWDAFGGFTDPVYGDDFELEIPVMGANGVLLIGLVRYEVAKTEGYAEHFLPDSDVGNADHKIARNRALAMLHTGEMDKVKYLLKNSETLEADYLRSILWGGDNYIEGVDASFPAAFLQNIPFASGDGTFARNDILCLAKVTSTYDSPYVMESAS